MPVIPPATWKFWLQNHPGNPSYSSHPDRVRDIGAGTDHLAIFERLTRHKNLGVLSKAQFGSKLQINFFCSTIGVPILTEDIRHAVRTNVESGSGMLIDPKSFLAVSTARYVPSLAELLKVKDKAGFDALTPKSTGSKHRLRNFVILPPDLLTEVMETDLTVTSVFLKVTELIRAGIPIPQPAAPDPSTNPGSTLVTCSPSATGPSDDDLKAAADPYDEILWSLWGLKHKEDVFSAPTLGPLQDADCLAWDTETTASALGSASAPPGPQVASSVPGQMQAPQTNTTAQNLGGALTAITKLSASLVKTQERSIELQKEKDDPKIKAWKKVALRHKNVILLAGIDEHGDVPLDPTDELLTVLTISNGADACQYLQSCMSTYNLALVIGLCTAIHKGILINPDDSGLPTNLSPFLTPPLRDDKDELENHNNLQLALKEKLDAADVTLLTKMEVVIPMTVEQLRHHIRNFAGVIGRLIGQDSQLFINLTVLWKHIEARETRYKYEFRQDKMFGGCFLEEVDWKVHRFLDSCAHGDPAQMIVDHIDFMDLMSLVESRKYVCKAPLWLKRLTKKTTPRVPDEPTSDTEGVSDRLSTKAKRRRYTEPDARAGLKIETTKRCLLKPDERFKWLFTPAMLRGTETPKMANGHSVCLRGHTTGRCFSDCRFKSGHSPLDSRLADAVVSFTNVMRNKRKDLANGTARGTGEPHTPTPGK